MSGASNHAATDLREKCLSLTEIWNLVTIFVHLGVKTLTKQVNPQLTIAIKFSSRTNWRPAGRNFWNLFSRFKTKFLALIDKKYTVFFSEK